MLRKIIICLLAGICFFRAVCSGQSASSGSHSIDSLADRLVNFPSKLFSRISGKTASLEQSLTRQTEKYLRRMAKREARLKKKLYRLDSTAAKRLFNAPPQSYAALAQKLKSDTGGTVRPVSGEYLFNLDSERVSLSFLQQNPQLLGTSKLDNTALQSRIQSSVSQLQALQAKMQDAGQIQEYVQQHKEEIKQYLSRYTQLPAGLSHEYQELNQDLYYYTQRVSQYKQMLNDPDKMEKQSLTLLNQLPAFQQFMKSNSQLAMLFGMPANFGTPQALAGLQTRDQLQQMIQGQLSSGGQGGMAAFQQNLQSAQSRLDQYKDKLTKLGEGGSNVDMPDFKPNNEKTKSFLKRLEFGTNFQTTSSTYFPVTTDFGLSVGYKLNKNNSVGVGASYKLGWGTGFNHIALSNQGAGLRSYLDIHLKGSLSATGGLEYNYATPFSSLQQIRRLSYWTQSGLIGISKTISVKSRAFKKTTLQLFWDFLSYQQVPRTQPILFRIGYTF